MFLFFAWIFCVVINVMTLWMNARYERFTFFSIIYAFIIAFTFFVGFSIGRN